MKIFVVFKKQVGEITNAYSLVTPKIYATIPKDIILARVEVEDKLYTKEDLQKLLYDCLAV